MTDVSCSSPREDQPRQVFRDGGGQPYRPTRRDLLRGTLAATTAWVSGGGCRRVGPLAADRVHVYVSLDREFSEPILRTFETQTGLTVVATYDSEKDKSIGLTERLVAERDDPSADVFWNNEPVNTVWLARQGLFEPYRPTGADDIPPVFRDPQGLWTGFAARARVILANTTRLDGNTPPTSLAQMAVLSAAGQRCLIARPVAGTTASHVAALFALAGAELAKSQLTELKNRGVNFQGASNSDVAAKVARGEFAAGLTDTDDALAVIRQAKPVTMIFPTGDQPWDKTLILPNTAALIKGAPNADHGRRLLDWLTSRTVERMLAAGPGAQLPVRTDIPGPAELSKLQRDAWMTPNFETVADQRQASAEFVRKILLV